MLLRLSALFRPSVALIIFSAASAGVYQARAQDSKPHPSSTPATREAGSSIEGQVTDPAGQRIPGALIEWGWIYDPPEKLQRTTTDDRGHFRLEPRAYGIDFCLAASAPGRAPQWVVPFPSWNSSLRDLPRDSDAVPPKTVNFQLEPEHRISGVVVDEQGEPIQGVQVVARTASEGVYSSFSVPSPPLRIPGPKATTTTNAKGMFRLAGLPADHVQLNLKSPHRHVNDANYPVDRTCRIVMTGSGQAGVLRVKVVENATRRPVPAFTVVRRYDPKPRTFNTPDGRFEWADVTAGGQYSLYIYSKDHAPAVLNCVGWPTGAEEEDVAELLPGKPFVGRLLDANSGKPVGGIPVLYGVRDEEKSDYFEWPDRDSYVDGHHGLTGVQRAVTDNEGRFWFSETEEGPQGTLFALAEGYERLILLPEDRPTKVPEDGHVSIEMHPEATISGVLLNAKATQADSVSVWKLQPRTPPEATYERYPVDPQGKYRIRGLGPGTYLVSYSQASSRAVRTSERFATVTLSRGEQKVLEPKEVPDQPRRGVHE